MITQLYLDVGLPEEHRKESDPAIATSPDWLTTVICWEQRVELGRPDVIVFQVERWPLDGGPPIVEGPFQVERRNDIGVLDALEGGDPSVCITENWIYIVCQPLGAGEPVQVARTRRSESFATESFATAPEWELLVPALPSGGFPDISAQTLSVPYPGELVPVREGVAGPVVCRRRAARTTTWP